MTNKVLILPGDGIGPEIVAEARKVLDFFIQSGECDLELEEGLIGGCAVDAEGQPYPESTSALAKNADAILLGAVGGPQYDALPRDVRPEKGLLRIREDLDLFANLRPALAEPELSQASSLKADLVSGLDIMIVRELTGGIYFGQPRGETLDEQGHPKAFNTMVYTQPEIERILRTAFELAQKRDKRLCSVDKANVLEVSELWRSTCESMRAEFPDVEVTHMYVDNAAMQLVLRPKQFDVLVTSNLFGDILSDIAAMLTGSIGMLPSASMNAQGLGMFEPIHGSAPDLAGQNKANPLATILSVAMLLRYGLNQSDLAGRIQQAVRHVLSEGLRTADICEQGSRCIGTREMGDAVIKALQDASN